jgi:hypothetical protein
MKFSEIITLSAALATSASAGFTKRAAAPDNVDITFEGAADASFTQSFPTDGSDVTISKLLITRTFCYDIAITNTNQSPSQCAEHLAHHLQHQRCHLHF